VLKEFRFYRNRNSAWELQTHIGANIDTNTELSNIIKDNTNISHLSERA